MAIVTICDKCKRIISDEVDHVDIRYNYRTRPTQVIQNVKTVTLCDKCYREVFGDQLELLKNEREINV